LLEVDCTDENTGDIADAMRHSLKRLFGADIGNIPTRVYGQCTDSGGGGTGKKIFLALQQLCVTSQHYLTTRCSLHNLQTALRNGVQLVLGEEEGLREKNIKLEELILTKWPLVGCCACGFLGSMSTWEHICKGITKSAPANSAAYKVASATSLLINQPMIISDIHILSVIHR